MHTVESIIQAVKDSNCNRVKVAVTDIDGILRGKYIHKDKFFSAIKSGFGFCSVVFGWDCQDTCYEKGTVGGWHNGYPDVVAHIDLNTFRTIPWDDNTPFFLGDFQTEDEKYSSYCPRTLLKSVLDDLQREGFNVDVGVEYEWFNFRETPQSLRDKHFVNPEPLTPGMFGYSILRQAHNQPFFQALMEETAAFGIPIEGLHTETGPGVYEAAITVCPALEAADKGVLLKTAIKEIAFRFGIVPTFMARWSNQFPGCGGHLHQSLWDKHHAQNLFYDARDPFCMSDYFKHYLAGQLHCLPEILPFFAPNVNSYKRLVEGFWAPTKTTWGVDNRTTAIRVIPGSEKSTRLEFRVPGSDINPYLGIAACIASGLYGVRNKLPLTMPQVVGNAYQAEGAQPLARNLLEATEKLSKSALARELFGEKFVEHFVTSRLCEHKKLQETVTTAERERYFEII